MKFIVDAQLPPALAAWLRAAGHDAMAAREVGLREADDATIWAYAIAQNAVIVTKDEDFARLAANEEGPSVLWVRTGNAINRMLLARFAAAWPQIITYLEDGLRLVELR